MAMEFCSDRLPQSVLFWSFLRVLPESQRRPIAVRHGARFHPPRRSAARGQKQGCTGRTARIFVAPAKGLGTGTRVCVLQLHFLSLADVAAVVSLVSPSH